MGNLVSNISWFLHPKQEKYLVSNYVDYSCRDVPVVITDYNIELPLSVVNSEPLENFKTGENDSVINPLNDQPAETTIAIMPKTRAKPRPKPKPRSVQIKERALMLSDDSLSQNTFHKVTGTIKPLPNRPSFFGILDSSSDEDTDYEPDENEAQNAEQTKIEETKKINPNPSEVSVPRTQKLDKNGQPIYEKCQCYWHRHRNVFID